MSNKTLLQCLLGVSTDQHVSLINTLPVLKGLMFGRGVCLTVLLIFCAGGGIEGQETV